MKEQLWTVTHVTATGEWRMWTVDNEHELGRIEEFMGLLGRRSESTMPAVLDFAASTGYVVIWLTPGQSLTVERAR
jgi:hypothetical protein